MSLTRLILTLLVALLIGGTSLLQAEDNAGNGNGGGNRGGIRGSITAIDLDKKTVTLKGTGDPVVYTTNDQTKYSIDRKDSTLADLKVGDTGFVRVDTTDKTLAVRISIRRTGAPGGAGGAGGAAPAGTTPPAGQ
jgi:hypothetical protein